MLDRISLTVLPQLATPFQILSLAGVAIERAQADCYSRDGRLSLVDQQLEASTDRSQECLLRTQDGTQALNCNLVAEAQPTVVYRAKNVVLIYCARIRV
jgi:hypothetical protein